MEENNRFYDRVRQTIEEHRLILPEEKVLVALSGGADSVALLAVLLRAGVSCEAVHCNFHLRGEESDRDETFVRDLCRTLSVHLYVKDFDTKGYAREKGVSLEMAARDLRYAYFEELLADGRLAKVAVAHHRNDNVETLLLNLVRGTGLKGLTGMRYLHGHVIRPLLDVGREDIEAFVAEEGLGFVTDSTNLETDAVRNKLRFEVLPLLKEINPGIVETLQSTIHRMDDAYTLYNMAIGEIKERVLHDPRIDITALKSLPASCTVLYELLSAYGFNSAQVKEIHDRLEGESGKVYESAEWRLLRDRKVLVLDRKSDRYECLCHVLPLDGFVRVTPDVTFSIHRSHNGKSFVIPRRKDTVCLDLEKLEFPITVRFTGEGDRFVPFGMTGEKLVSDYLTDVKKSLFEKERQLVVCSGDRVAWIVGERADNRFRIDEHTTHVLMIQCLKEK
ncbi:MAG: tRNA lysidine(34) synthetase TilS [Paraprevotella sp.]|nr:tRNA lysidine(34) synthetase TilS [Paraprevotella sp.]